MKKNFILFSLLLAILLLTSGCETFNAVQALAVKSQIVEGYDEKANKETIDCRIKIASFLSSWTVLHLYQNLDKESEQYSYGLAIESNDIKPIAYDKIIFYCDSIRSDWIIDSTQANNPKSYSDSVNTYWRNFQVLFPGAVTTDAESYKKELIDQVKSITSSTDNTLKAFERNSSFSINYTLSQSDVELMAAWLNMIKID